MRRRFSRIRAASTLVFAEHPPRVSLTNDSVVLILFWIRHDLFVLSVRQLALQSKAQGLSWINRVC